jgi:hypothetical protein
MIPTGVASVIAFIFFIAPGLAWELLVERRRPEISESAFREASRVALASTPFSVVSTAVVLIAAWRVNPSWTRDLSNWAISGNASNSQAIVVASCVALAELIFALLLVLLAWSAFADRWYGTARAYRKSAWGLFLNASGKNEVKIATVRLAGGSTYRGRVVAFSNDLAWQDREILLQSPLFLVGDNGTLTRLPDEYIAIPAASMESVSSLTVSTELADRAATEA